MLVGVSPMHRGSLARRLSRRCAVRSSTPRTASGAAARTPVSMSSKAFATAPTRAGAVFFLPLRPIRGPACVMRSSSPPSRHSPAGGRSPKTACTSTSGLRASATTAERPVMVWFHGGAYSGGTSNEIETDGERLARKGRRCRRHRQSSPQRVWIPLSRAELGSPDLADSGTCRTARSDPGLRSGVRDNAVRIRRRRRQRHDLRALRRRREERHADGDAEGERTVPSGGHARAASRSPRAVERPPPTHALAAARRRSRLDRSQVDQLRTMPMEQLVKVQPCARVSRPGQGWTVAATRSVRSRCAAAIGAHPDDPRQHERRDADADRPRRSVDLSR